MNRVILRLKDNFISRKSVMLANEFIVKLYGRTCYRLYQLGFCSKPFQTDIQEVLAVFRVEFPNYYNFINNRYAGIVCTKPLMFKYILTHFDEVTNYVGNCDSDLDALEVIQLLYDLTYCELGFNTLNDIRKYFVLRNKGTKYGFPKTNNLTKIENNIYSESFLSESFMNIFYKDLISLTTPLYAKIYISEYIKQEFLADVGATNSSNIDRDYISLYIIGDLDLPDKEDAEKFKVRVKNYYNEELEHLTDKPRHRGNTLLMSKSYYNYIFEKATERIEKISNIEDVDYCDGNTFYSRTGSNKYTSCIKEAEEGKTDLTKLGVLIKEYNTDTTDLELNLIAGYSGEFISATYAFENYEVCGYPVILLRNNQYEYFYHIHTLKDKGARLNSHINNVPSIKSSQIFGIDKSVLVLKGSIDIQTREKKNKIYYIARTLFVGLVASRECINFDIAKLLHRLDIKIVLQNINACNEALRWYNELYTK